MNRPDLTIPDFALVPTGGAPAQGAALNPLPSASTPVMSLFREWTRLYDHANDPSTSEADSEAATDAQLDLEKVLLATPSQTVADFAAKVAAFTSWGVFSLPAEEDDPTFVLWAEARALIGA